ncbi:MAG: Fic family protein [Candidatus Tyrphobacter sp.]
MASFEIRRWEPPFSLGGLPRKERRPCDYRVYLPDKLVGRPIMLDGDVAADTADAERAIARLNVGARALVDTEALARLLLRAESVASSRIEGLEIGARRLLRADAAREFGEAPTDVTAVEVLGNIDAMTFATQAIGEGAPITIDVLLEIHRRLLAATHLSEHAGKVRTIQNWIGKSAYNPCGAAFVPPPPDRVEPLLEDLCAFCNEDQLPAVAQAAIAHAQFETIHPFVDGNGRVGRALIHLVLRRRGLAERALPPISLVLATRANDYIGGLIATRYEGPPDGKAAHDGLNRWVGRFASAAQRSVLDATTFEGRVDKLEESWRERLGTVRRGSAADILLQKLPALPILTVNSAAALIGRSFLATNQAMERLVKEDILASIRAGRRNRAFEAPELISAFTDFERGLASPTGDTRTAPPARRVPHRRQFGRELLDRVGGRSHLSADEALRLANKERHR